ncbi:MULTISPECIES: polyprenyl diphosphate synthase [Acidiphilium]|uniref:polyprenyl diphosphate synthase n=1 Tax=Acidiphilium TaxID=522 RepID=UPI001B8BBDFE|nr:MULTISPECIES: polyprenyl diphosphate synthase [Acidiphilium]MBS3023028.1 di-trans,poly-cis-decaprenylcistransferase [Acidiphilium multivorum]
MSAPPPVPPPPVPRHIAIIMDGNGRWAARHGLPRAAGHREGVQAVRRTIEAAIGHGVEWLTLFAFSSENWRRPVEEVTDLTFLLRHYLRSELRELAEAGVRLHIIGERDRFGSSLKAELADAEARTAANRKLNLVIALSYGARAEIATAARRIAEAAMAGTLDPTTVDETIFAAHLSTAGMPDPDLVIRTSGEQRLSNFLLWQAAYAELVFDDALWPDFGAANLGRAIAEYARRERRFGARPGPADAPPHGEGP